MKYGIGAACAVATLLDEPRIRISFATLLDACAEGFGLIEVNKGIVSVTYLTCCN